MEHRPVSAAEGGDRVPGALASGSAAASAAVGPAGVRLRRMRREDLPTVSEIERASFPTPWSEATFRGLLGRANAALLVAETPVGELLGHAALWTAGPEAELGDLAVRPEARGRGVGRTLLLAALDEAERRGARTIFLEVRESNAAARGLYEAAGFAVVDRRAGYYDRPREDALVMRRSLTGRSASG